jgi:hypothetical protein
VPQVPPGKPQCAPSHQATVPFATGAHRFLLFDALCVRRTGIYPLPMTIWAHVRRSASEGPLGKRGLRWVQLNSEQYLMPLDIIVAICETLSPADVRPRP